MAKAMVVTYECEQCGTEVVVTEDRGNYVKPYLLLRDGGNRDIFC